MIDYSTLRRLWRVMALCPLVGCEQVCFLQMISMQRVLLKLLRILRFVKDYIVGRVAGRWSLFTAFLVRRISELRRSWDRKPGTSRNHPRAAEPLLPGNRASSYSVSGGSAVLREYVVAASTVPGIPGLLAASTASFQEDAGQSPASIPLPPSPTTSIQASLFVHQPHPVYGRNRAAGSSSNVSGSSAQSRASARLSTIVNSSELLHAPVNQPSRPRSARSVYRHFGPEVDPSPLRGQLVRSHSPSYRQNITRSDSRLSITPTSVSHPHDADEGRSPIAFPSPSPSTHGPQRPSTSRSMWGGSTSINLSIQSPSTDSLPIPLTEESTSEFDLPEGRVLQMIHSDQIPRYDTVTM